MKIIEFFGLPFSGKTHLSNKYKKKNIFSELFFYYIYIKVIKYHYGYINVLFFQKNKLIKL